MIIFDILWKQAVLSSAQSSQLLSKPQPYLNLNTTVGFDMKMTLQTPPHHHPQNFNVPTISAVTEQIMPMTKLNKLEL